MNFEQNKDWLLGQITNKAYWRAEKAAEYPDDLRNARSADALNQLAENLGRIPADHPLLRDLWRIEFGLRPASQESQDQIGLEILETLDILLGGYGFYGAADGNAEEFLSDLISNVEDSPLV